MRIRFARFFVVVSLVTTQLATIPVVRIAAGKSSRAQQGIPGTLAPGVTQEFQLTFDSAGRYRFLLVTNQILHVYVDQKGIDVNINVSSPSKKQLREIDGPGGLWGSETISLIATETGEYTLEVRPTEKGSAPGRFALRIEIPTTPNAADLDRVRAIEATIDARSKVRTNQKEALASAVKKYEEAEQIWHNLGDKEREAVTLMAIARAYRSLGDRESALSSLARAQKVWQAFDNTHGEAQTLNEIGRVYFVLNQPKSSFEPYQAALSKFKSLSLLTEQSVVRNNLGNSYQALGRNEEAIREYAEAIELAKAAHDLFRQVQGLNGRAAAFDRVGRRDEAIHEYSEALKIAEELQIDPLIATTLNNLGVLYTTTGDPQTELILERAISMGKSVPKDSLVNYQNNLGMFFATLGDSERSLSRYQQALAEHESAGVTKSSKAITFSGMGYAMASAGDWEKAKASYKKAMELLAENPNLRWKALTLTNLGVAYASTGEIDKANDCYRQALEIWDGVVAGKKVAEPVQDLQGTAYTLDKMGDVALLQNAFLNAEGSYTRALALWNTVGDTRGVADTLLGVAQVKRAKGDLREALNHADEAVNLIEKQRARAANEQLRMTYLASKQEVYELAIALRMQLHRQNPNGGYDAQALEMSEKLRARSLIDMLSRASLEKPKRVGADIWNKQTALQQELDETLWRKSVVLRNGSKSEADLISKKIDSLTQDLNAIAARIKSQDPLYGNLVELTPLTADQIRREVLTDENTLLLEYSLGERESYLWVTARTGRIQSYVLAPRREIEQQAKIVKCLLIEAEPGSQQSKNCVTGDSAQYITEATKLTKLILEPAAESLGTKRLIIVADGELQYLPFGVLPKGRPSARTDAHVVDRSGRPSAFVPFLVDHEIIYEPSASTLAFLRRENATRKPSGKTIAVLADPVFESKDSRLPKVSRGPSGDAKGNDSSSARSNALSGMTEPSLGRLLSSAQEARVISEMVAPSKRLIATGFAANWQTAVSPAISNYQNIHFATHAVINDRRPELSGIALSRFDNNGVPVSNNFLRLRDIYNLNLHANLVVLSACNTALGKRVRGEGLIGLTRGFMYAGTKRVVSSLWQADDAATADLMGHFYRHMFKERMTPAAALRAAQIDIWKQDPERSPYYWGAFIIHGEWR